VKFAVKEIHYVPSTNDLPFGEPMQVDSVAVEQGHIANSISTKVVADEFDEFEDVEAVVD